MTRIAIVITALALAGCAETRAPGRSAVVMPPASLMTCAEEPQAPVDAMLQSEVAGYLLRMHAAGADCRERLQAVREFLERERAAQRS